MMTIMMTIMTTMTITMTITMTMVMMTTMTTATIMIMIIMTTPTSWRHRSWSWESRWTVAYAAPLWRGRGWRCSAWSCTSEWGRVWSADAAAHPRFRIRTETLTTTTPWSTHIWTKNSNPPVILSTNHTKLQWKKSANKIRFFVKLECQR